MSNEKKKSKVPTSVAAWNKGKKVSLVQANKAKQKINNKKIPDKLPDYTIIKKLSNGLWGTVYLVSVKNKEYALKVQKIEEKETKKTADRVGKVWREVEFANEFTKKNPDLFCQLIAYEIIPMCEHEQKIKKSNFSITDEKWKEWEKAQESPYCIEYLYEYIDGITYQEFYKQKDIDYNDLCSSIAQIAQAHKLMNDAGYVLHDTHFQNMMIIQKDEPETLMLGKNKLSTRVFVKFIDFGEIYHDKFGLSAKEKKKMILGNTFYSILDEFWKEPIMELPAIQKLAKQIDTNELWEIIQDQAEYIYLIDGCVKQEGKKKNSIDKHAEIGLFKTMNLRGYYEICNYDSETKLSTQVQAAQKQPLTMSDFMILYKNVRQLDVVVNYFIHKGDIID